MNNQPKKPGLLARWIERLDNALKKAADKNTSCCCSGDCSTQPPQKPAQNQKPEGGSCC